MPNMNAESAIRSRRAVFLALMCTSALVAAPALAGSLPSGGQFVAGQGAISKKGSTGLSVKQSSQTGIIDWRGFSIGTGKSVRINNGSGATLNRVMGGNLSKIDGNLRATGSVYLINPQGVVVGARGRVVTNGSFVASSRDISDSDFLDGKKMTASGKSKGDVVNAGVISSNSGDAILVGRSVSNTGVLSARNGSATMAAADRVVLQPVGSQVAVAVAGGKGDVTNAGTVEAAQADLASAGGNVYALAGNSGVVRATGTSTINGHVWLTSHGNTQISGAITAQNADGSGGDVTVRAANVNVSGEVDASATQSRKAGGTVSIIARKTTVLGGTIHARGGKAGAGGAVETSGKHVHVADGAHVDTVSLHGKTGSWLIDPSDFIIAASGGDITGATLSSNLATTDVAISSNDGTVVTTTGHGDILVNDDVAWSSDHSLTLNAVRNIDFNADITANGTSAGLVLTYGGAEAFGPGASVTLSGASATLNINSTPYTLLHNITDVQNISSDLTGHYALAQEIDASATSGWNAGKGFLPLGNATVAFSGDFDGFGHTINDLFINNSTGIPVGLFGAADGATLENVGLVGGTITGIDTTGTLVGDFDNGTIINAYATINVTAPTSGDFSPRVGGLVGINESGGTISNAYATGKVRGGETTDAGGLVGANLGTITQSYATGAVVSGSEGQVIGGLVGVNAGTLSDVYAMGPTDGEDLSANSTGGLVGNNTGSINNSYVIGYLNGGGGAVAGINTGTIVNSYWVQGTTGATKGVGSGSDTTTQIKLADLQSTLQAGFDSSIWGIIPGSSLPYLKWQFTGTPEVVTGYSFDNPTHGSTETNLGAQLSNGDTLSLWTAKNGYYYFLLPEHAIEDAGGVLVYNSGTHPSASFADYASATASGFDLNSGQLHLATDASSYTTLQAELSAAINGDSAVQSLVGGLVNQAINSTGAFNIDSAFDNDGNVTITSQGNINITQAMDVGQTLTLDSTGKILESSAGSIDARTLTGTSVGTVNLSGANSVILLGNFDTSNGAFALKNIADLKVTGAVDAGTGRLTLTTAGAGNDLAIQNTLIGGTVVLQSGGTVAATAAGNILASTLTGISHGDATLRGTNVIGTLAAFSTNNGVFLLKDDADLAITGDVNAGTGTITLSTIGNGHDIAIESALTTKGAAGVVTLNSAGSATETNAGAIVTRKLNVTAKTGIKLTSPKNDIGSVGARSTQSGPNKITL